MRRGKKELLDNFKQITGCDNKLAEHYLDQAKWDFNTAANLYFEKGHTANVGNTSEMFNKYKNEKSKIDPVGLVNFLQDIGIDPSDPLCGYLMFLMACKNTDQIDAEEFNRLCYGIEASSLNQFKSKLPAVKKKFEDPEVFKQVYLFLFDNYKDTSKLMNFEVALALWAIYLKGRFTFYAQFIQFLQKYNNPISKDTWKMVYEFEEILKGDLSKYSENDGWPILIDSFVESTKK